MITLADARRIISAAETKASEIGPSDRHAALAGIAGAVIVLLVLTGAFSTIILARRTEHSQTRENWKAPRPRYSVRCFRSFSQIRSRTTANKSVEVTAAGQTPLTGIV